MTIGVLRITLRLPSRTLKEKRALVRPLVERIRSRYNASVAEVDALDSPKTAMLAVAVVSNESRHADDQLQEIAAAVRELRLDAEVIDVETELIDA